MEFWITDVNWREKIAAKCRGYKKDAEEIKKHVEYLRENYGFAGPLHFTDFENLRTIIEQGYLYSRCECVNKSISYVDGANHSVLNKASEYILGCVRFYYRGQTPTLYDNEGIKLRAYCCETHIPIPVFLLFDEELLYLDSTEFSNGNATNSDIGNSIEFFKGIDWNTVFHNTWFQQEEKSYIINKRHAELLSKSPVSVKYLKNIIFRSEADKKRAINLFGNDDRYMIDVGYFSKKNKEENCSKDKYNNYINDYEISFKNTGNVRYQLDMNLRFQKEKFLKDDYEIELVVMNKYDEIIDLKKNYVLNYEKKKVKLIIDNYLNEYSKLNVIVNGTKCVEENLDKFNKYLFTLENVDKTTKNYLFFKQNYLELKFNCDIKKYLSRYKLLDDNNTVVNEVNIDLDTIKNNILLIKITKKMSNYKLLYFINNALIFQIDLK